MWKQPRCPPVREWTEQLWHVCAGGYESAVGKEDNFTLCDGMDGPGEHHGEWNEPLRERPCDFMRMWNLISKTDRQTRSRPSDAENGRAAVGGQGFGGWARQGKGLSQNQP